MRTLLTVIALTLATLVPLTGTAAAQPTTDPAAEMLQAINAERAARDLPALITNIELQGIAQDWTARMQADQRLSHNPHYASSYSGHWTRMGENVGTITRHAASADEMIAELHGAFMDSAGHAANVLGDYNQAGIGVVQDGTTMWVTVNFLNGEVPERPAEPEQPAPPAEPAHRRTPTTAPHDDARGWDANGYSN